MSSPGRVTNWELVRVPPGAASFLQADTTYIQQLRRCSQRAQSLKAGAQNYNSPKT